MVVKRV